MNNWQQIKRGVFVRKTLVVIIGAIIVSSSSAIAQTDEAAVVLPLEAQTCNLPVAPARIPEEAGLDELRKAKGNMTGFQTKMVSYRECLDDAIQSETATKGNKDAVGNAHDYSVDMEERIAEQFNMALCKYKQREDMALSDTCKQRLGLAD
jgi:hypothetical protein